MICNFILEPLAIKKWYQVNIITMNATKNQVSWKTYNVSFNNKI